MVGVTCLVRREQTTEESKQGQCHSDATAQVTISNRHLLQAQTYSRWCIVSQQ